MIKGIRGDVVSKNINFCDVLTPAGIIFRVHISLNCYSKLTPNVQLFTSYIVKEDSHSLYGFLDEQEQQMFEMLIKINGIGPKVGMAICSTFAPSDFAKILSQKDQNALLAVPGIGKKSAGLILVSLSDFLPMAEDSITYQARLALENLGFKKDKILNVLSKCQETSLEGLIKEALLKLNN